MDSEILILKSKLKKAKSALSSELDRNKNSCLAFKHSFDQLKSKRALHSLVLKKKQADARTILADSRLVWISELINIKNSTEIFQATQEKKKLIKEELFENLKKIRPLFESFQNFLEEKEGFQMKSSLNESYNCNESTMEHTMVGSVDSLNFKAKELNNYSGAYLTAVDEKIEKSFGTENEESFSSCLESENTEKASLSSLLKSEDIEKNSLSSRLKNEIIEKSSFSSSSDNEKIEKASFSSRLESEKIGKASISSHSESENIEKASFSVFLKYENMEKVSLSSRLKNESIEKASLSVNSEEVDDTMIGLVEKTGPILTTLEVYTIGNKKENTGKDAYVLSEQEFEANEVQVKKRSWKAWVCPCIFKLRYK